MGAWGAKLYEDDIALDVKDYYKDQLHRGKSGEEITQELLQRNVDILSDPDDAPVFWFALADTQWALGRLESFVKEHALNHIHNGYDLKRWERESPREAKIRRKVLSDLEQKLLLPQPAEKKISQYRLYHCEWNIGDVFAYQLNSDYAKEMRVLNKYIYFVKVDNAKWYPGHVVPVVYFYWTISDKLLNISELKNIGYIPQFFIPKVYEDNPKMNTLYLLTLLSTSAKVIPQKKLIFIGNVMDVRRIDNEDLNAYQVSWKNLEEYIINNFNEWKGFQLH